MWFIGVEVEQETSAPPPEKNPGSAPIINYGLAPQGDWPKFRLKYLLDWNRKSALCIAICTSKQGNPYQYVWPKLEGHQQCL